MFSHCLDVGIKHFKIFFLIIEIIHPSLCTICKVQESLKYKLKLHSCDLEITTVINIFMYLLPVLYLYFYIIGKEAVRGVVGCRLHKKVEGGAGGQVVGVMMC